MHQLDMVSLSSGRRVAVRRLAHGDGGRTVVFCHPAPGAGNFDPNPDETAKRGLTLIAVDRPAYGASDPAPGNQWVTVASAADDLAKVLEQMQIGPVGVAGWSAGGREVHNLLAAQLEQMLLQDSSREARFALLGKSPADDDALAMPGAADRLAEMMEAAFAQGTIGLATDIAGYSLRPWGFEPAQVQAKTLCLYGAADPVFGSRHGTWWQKNLPLARLGMVPDAGHLLIFPMWKRVLSHLALGRRSS